MPSNLARNQDLTESSEIISQFPSIPFPFVTSGVVLILALSRPDLLVDMTNSLAYHTNLPVSTLAAIVVGCIFAFVILSFGLWYAYKAFIEYLRNRAITKTRMLRERNALVAIFNATNGNQWTDKTRWLSNEPVSRWKGIKVDRRTGFVNKLLFANNSLTGTLPEAIGDLEGLIEIDLRDNDIGGPIPASLSTLHSLQGLYLFNNRFTGKIPDELSDLPLTGIYLYNNYFEDIERSKILFKQKLSDESHIFI